MFFFFTVLANDLYSTDVTVTVSKLPQIGDVPLTAWVALVESTADGRKAQRDHGGAAPVIDKVLSSRKINESGLDSESFFFFFGAMCVCACVCAAHDGVEAGEGEGE